MVKMNEDKAAMYLVAIVGVVAAVGIIVLLMGVGISSTSDNYTGQAIASTTKSASAKTNTVPLTFKIYPQNAKMLEKAKFKEISSVAKQSGVTTIKFTDGTTTRITKTSGIFAYDQSMIKSYLQAVRGHAMQQIKLGESDTILNVNGGLSSSFGTTLSNSDYFQQLGNFEELEMMTDSDMLAALNTIVEPSVMITMSVEASFALMDTMVSEMKSLALGITETTYESSDGSQTTVYGYEAGNANSGDVYESHPGERGNTVQDTDTDDDGTQNYLDSDADGDGIPNNEDEDDDGDDVPDKKDKHPLDGSRSLVPWTEGGYTLSSQDELDAMVLELTSVFSSEEFMSTITQYVSGTMSQQQFESQINTVAQSMKMTSLKMTMVSR